MRRFGLLDAVILVAALAAASHLARMCFYEDFSRSSSPAKIRLSFIVVCVHHGLAACAAPLGAAIIVLRLRRPRPRLPAVLQQPGFIGCIVSTLVFGMCVASMVPGRSLSSVLFLASFAIAYSIMGTWFAVLFGGYWNPDTSWIERMARSVCVFWLCAPFLLCLGLTAV